MLPILFVLALQQPADQSSTRDTILQEDIASAIRRLGGDDYFDAWQAKLELTTFGRNVIPPLLEEFRANTGANAERNIRVRFWIIEILGELREASDEAIGLLIRSLEDPALFGSTRVCAAAAATLGLLGNARAIDPLIKALRELPRDYDKHYKGELITALGNLRALGAEELLRQAFESDDSKTLTEEFERDNARLISALAAEALGKIRAKGSVPALCKRLQKKLDDPEDKKDPLSQETLTRFIVRALKRIEADLAAKTDEEVLAWGVAKREEIIKAEQEAEAARKKEQTRATMKKLEAALVAYKAENGKFPASIRDLRPKHWPETEPLQDAWANEFGYKAPGSGGADYDLVSYGTDGKPGGVGIDEDLWNHDKWYTDYRLETEKLLREVKEAIEKFQAEQGRLPILLRDLVEKPGGAKNYPEGGYLKGRKAPILDPFGGELSFKVPGPEGKPFDLRSMGLDRKEGGDGPAADISVWSLQ